MAMIRGQFGKSVSYAISSVSGVAFSHWVKHKVGNNKTHGLDTGYLAFHRDNVHQLTSDTSCDNDIDLSTDSAIRLKLVLSVWLELSRPPFPSRTFRDLVSPFTQRPILEDYNISDQQFVQMQWYSLVMVVLPPPTPPPPAPCIETPSSRMSRSNNSATNSRSAARLFENVEALEMPRDCVSYLSTMIGLVYIPSVYSLLTFFHPISGKPMPRLLCQEGRVYDIYGIPLPTLSYDVSKQMLTHTVTSRPVTFANKYQYKGTSTGATAPPDNGLATSIITAAAPSGPGAYSRLGHARSNAYKATIPQPQTVVRRYPVPQINCTNTSLFDCQAMLSLLEKTVSCSWMYGNAPEPLLLSPRATSVASAVSAALGVSMPLGSRLPCGIPHGVLGEKFPVATNIEIRGQTKAVSNGSSDVIIETRVSGIPTDFANIAAPL